MKAAVMVSLVMATPAAAGTDCSSGYKHKKDLTNLFCTNNSTSKDACNAGCCEADMSTCGGLANSKKKSSCEFGSHADSDYTWKSTKTTAYDETKKTFDQKQFQKDCCKPDSTCASTLYTCQPGMKQKSGVAAVHCPSDSASCAKSTACCEPDKTTCGGHAKANVPTFVDVKCAAGTYPQTKEDAILSDDNWRKQKNTGAGDFTPTTFRAQCCQQQPTCSSAEYKCDPGFERDPANKDEVCKPDSIKQKTYPASTCVSDATVGNKKCCKAVDTTCGGSTAPVCSGSQYYPSTNDNWKSKKIVKNKQNTECCTVKATCAVAQCKAGWIKKANVDTLSCPGGKDSCAEAAARCCEVNKLTCGGLAASIQCAYGYYNPSTYFDSKTAEGIVNDWKNRAATAANKNTVCCQAKAMCVNGITTTPAATVTPAAPVAARLFSAHKTATKTEQAGSSVLWVGAGAVLGMAVLAAMQRARGTQEPVHHSIRELEPAIE